MSDYSSMATLQNNSQPAGFAAAVQRASLIAAKIGVGGSKRSLEDGSEPSAKKLAQVDTGFPQQQSMSYSLEDGGSSSTTAAVAAVAAAAARIAASNTIAPPAPPPGGPPNLMQDQQINDYIRVPDKMVGLIIGRGGEQITRLQAESGCKIQMAPDSGGQPDRLCTLTGSREAIARAKDLVNQIVNHRGRENAPQHQDGQGGSIGGGPPMPRPGGGGGGGGGSGLAVTDEIMLPGPKVGLIIGKNGKTIKQLQEQSGAKMVVIQDGPNTEYEKPLRISGDPTKVEHAKQLVYELLADKDMNQGGPRPYDSGYPQDPGNGIGTNSTEVLVPKIAVGVVIGRNGDMIKKIQAETGCRVQFHQDREDDRAPMDKRCFLQGKPHQVEQARQMIEDLISSVNRREQDERAGRGRAGAARNGTEVRPEREYQWQEQPQDLRVTFTVSNVKCGLIIGRRGEVIKQINAQTGAHCELDRRAQGNDRNNRTFYIRGHPEAVEHCKRIIVEKVGMPVNFIPEGNGNGNGGNGGGNGNGSDMYGAGGSSGGQPAWGYNPHWHQPAAQQQQQQQQVNINPVTGQPDYSQQWIDYYRSLGLMREAEAVEQQAKQQQQQAATSAASSAAAAPAPSSGSNASASSSGGGSGGADYSAQWAEYYRSIGKMKEAEAIEAQIKLKQQQQQPTPTLTAAPTPSPVAQSPAPSSSMPYNAHYPMYPPGAPVYPGYAPYGAYPPSSEHQQ